MKAEPVTPLGSAPNTFGIPVSTSGYHVRIRLRFQFVFCAGHKKGVAGKKAASEQRKKAKEAANASLEESKVRNHGVVGKCIPKIECAVSKAAQ